MGGIKPAFYEARDLKLDSGFWKVNSEKEWRSFVTWLQEQDATFRMSKALKQRFAPLDSQ